MPYHIGIELSPSFFKLAEVKKRRNKMWLYQYVVHPLPSIWSRESSIWEREEFIQSVQEALLDRDLHTKRVHVAINSKYVIYKRVMVPEMRKRKYRSWLEEHLLPVLDLPFSDPVFDFQLINHVWADGDEQEVLLAITSSSYIDFPPKPGQNLPDGREKESYLPMGSFSFRRSGGNQRRVDSIDRSIANGRPKGLMCTSDRNDYIQKQKD